jgi:5-methylcytosine-specific restriction endonuclease McrA
MIGARTRARVRERAQNICEYCHLHQHDSPLAALHIEHVVPKIHGGTDDPDNLALACIDCNLHKGTNLTGIDPETSEVTELFLPGGKTGRTISSGAEFI